MRNFSFVCSEQNWMIIVIAIKRSTTKSGLKTHLVKLRSKRSSMLRCHIINIKKHDEKDLNLLWPNGMKWIIYDNMHGEITQTMSKPKLKTRNIQLWIGWKWNETFIMSCVRPNTKLRAVLSTTGSHESGNWSFRNNIVFHLVTFVVTG